MRPQQMVQSKPDREDHRRLLIAVAAICGLLAVLAVTGAWLISSSQRGNLAARPNELPVEGFEPTREARLLAEASGSSSAFGTDSAGSGSSGVFVPEGILAGFCTLAVGALILQLISGLPLPYTVVLLLLGMLLGVAVLATGAAGAFTPHWASSVVEFQYVRQHVEGGPCAGAAAQRRPPPWLPETLPRPAGAAAGGQPPSFLLARPAAALTAAPHLPAAARLCRPPLPPRATAHGAARRR